MMKCKICETNLQKLPSGHYPKYCSSECKTLGMQGTPPKCESIACNNITTRGSDGRWLKYCCKECRDLPTTLKRQATWKKTLGVDHPSKASDFVDKCHETSTINYGVDHFMKLKSTKETKKEASLEKYGVEHHLSANEVKQKKTETLNRKYNRDNASQIHLSENTIQKMHDIDFLRDELTRKSVKEISENLGTSISHMYALCADMELTNHIGSGFEIEVGQFLKDNGIQFEVRNRQIISPKEIDIFIPTHNIAIECNGTYWHSELNGKDKDFHLTKTQLCADKNIHLIHLWQHIWDNKRDIACSRILSILGKSEKIYARKCIIKEITSAESRCFAERTHIHGFSAAALHLGLFYEDELVSVLTLGKPRFNKKYEYELIRFSSKLNTTVVGGGSKLFNYFIKKYNPKSIISYSDRSWNKGGIYTTLGFTKILPSAPAPSYTKDYNHTENRIANQSYKLKIKLPIYNETISAWENLKANGYDRIWDCGNDIFIWINSQINS